VGRYDYIGRVQMVPVHFYPPRSVRLAMEQALAGGRLDDDGEVILTKPLYQIVRWSDEFNSVVAVSHRDEVPLGPIASKAFREWQQSILPRLKADFWADGEEVVLLFDSELASPMMLTAHAASLLLERARDQANIPEDF
jgi:hypothetical protein